jgi:KipI family sensor histidine kinase inhibitor
MTPEPFGDAAFVLAVPAAPDTVAAGRVRRLARAIASAAPPGTTDVVASADRVTVAYDIGRVGDVREFAAALAAVAAGVDADGAAEPVARHEFPVHYGGVDGPDIGDVAAHFGGDAAAVARLHAGADYVVEALGYVPGFAYLAGLPAELATPRRATPRPRVAAGSVGIGGARTGVYPFATPGGWHLIGRTTAALFDVTRAPPSLLAVGDRVRFVGVTAGDLAAHEPPAPARTVPLTDPTCTVLAPGLTTTIQDLGRLGQRDAGIPQGGAADAVSLRLANLAVGNPESAAALECTLTGPELRFERDAVVALAGADFTGLPRGRPVRLAAGGSLALGHSRSGCRGYLAFAGGLRVDPVLGSRATYAPARLGGLDGRPLVAGDRLALEHAGRGAPALDTALDPALFVDPPAAGVLRVIPAAGSTGWDASYRTSARSDRIGVRLEGAMLAGGGGDGVSAAVLPGTVQLPPDGRPIILLADAQTIGGYRVIGHVITADLPLVAQLRPGAAVAFRPTTLAEAHAAFHAQAARLAAARGAAVASGSRP